ncbi:MAG: HAMP domain-containing histidine kinase, partial [Planctomycetaceae bacterium]|nr:HAMP domain-containing histidine kinase [Planctomycetaceae bacterium]
PLRSSKPCRFGDRAFLLLVEGWRQLMRWPIRNQILLPFVLLLTITVCLTAGVSAWYAARHSRQQRMDHLVTIVRSLTDSSFPVTQDIAERIAGLTDGEVIAVDDQQAVYASTVQTDEKLTTQLRQLSVSQVQSNRGNQENAVLETGMRNTAGSGTDERESSSFQTVFWNSSVYRVAVIPRRSLPRPGKLYVLIPEQQLDEVWRQALLMPIGIGAITLVVALAISVFLSRHIAGRIDRVRRLFGAMESGSFQTVDVSGRNDEVRDLLVSANHLSAQLQKLQREIQTTERLNLLSQLSGGLAHQLRNSIAGARLAVQLHQKNCGQDGDGMLETAVAQLRLTEEQVRAVLSLRKSEPLSETRDQPPAKRIAVMLLLQEVADLVRPHCEHRRTRLTVSGDPEICLSSGNVDAFRGALLNLIMNAVEAAGVHGLVEACVHRTAGVEPASVVIEIRDSGPGFSSAVADHVAEAFVTTRPDGIGLGLTIARQAVTQAGGQLTFDRRDEMTIVQVTLPLAEPAVSNAK